MTNGNCIDLRDYEEVGTCCQAAQYAKHMGYKMYKWADRVIDSSSLLPRASIDVNPFMLNPIDVVETTVVN